MELVEIADTLLLVQTGELGLKMSTGFISLYLQNIWLLHLGTSESLPERIEPGGDKAEKTGRLEKVHDSECFSRLKIGNS